MRPMTISLARVRTVRDFSSLVGLRQYWVAVEIFVAVSAWLGFSGSATLRHGRDKITIALDSRSSRFGLRFSRSWQCNSQFDEFHSAFGPDRHFSCTVGLHPFWSRPVSVFGGDGLDFTGVTLSFRDRPLTI